MVGTGRKNREATVQVPGIGRVVANIEQVYNAGGELEIEVLLGATRVDPEPLAFLDEEELEAVARALQVSY